MPSYASFLKEEQARASLMGEWDWSVYDNCPDAPAQRNSKGLNGRGLTLFPNPAIHTVVLDLGNIVSAGAVSLLDLHGRTLKTWHLHEQRQIQLQLDTEISSGLYLLEVTADQSAPQVLKLSVEQH